VFEYVPSEAEEARNITTSVWVALAPDPDTILSLQIASAGDAHLWRPLMARKGFAGWSDDYASLLPLLEDWRSWLPDVMRDME
jgi:hypothetical protein